MPIISRVAENVKVTVDTKRRERKTRDTRKVEEGRNGRGGNADETSARLFSSPLTFRDTGDREVQDGMTLIRLITVIIRLRLAESKGVSRLGAPEKGRRRKRRGGTEQKKKNERERFVRLSRFPAKNSIFVSDEVSKGRDANIARAL